MKTRLFALFAFTASLAFAAVGQKFTEGTERVVSLGLTATWTEGQTTPDSVSGTATMTVKIANDADATEARDVRVRSVEFNAQRADRSITLPGIGSMTYQQVVRAAALMAKDAADRPQATAITAATAGNAQVALAWVAAQRATSYTVKRGTVSGGPYANLATGVTQTTHTDATAENGTTYYYVVASVNATGSADNSAQVSAAPVAP